MDRLKVQLKGAAYLIIVGLLMFFFGHYLPERARETQASSIDEVSQESEPATETTPVEYYTPPEEPVSYYEPEYELAPEPEEYYEYSEGCPITTCNDGSCSESTGRGTCSWHGGVAY